MIESYFSGKWSDNSLDTYAFSGWSLIDKVNSLNPKKVLDVGCGFNRFKNKINNLIGIDPYNDAADFKISLEQYRGPIVDIVLCLGSINFGDENIINQQLEILDKLWTKKAFFRVNPGIPHTWCNQKDWEGIIWYTWSKKKIYDVANNYKYKIDLLEEEYTIQGDLRYYFEFTK